MQRIRSSCDADYEDKFKTPTAYQTMQNKNELNCSLCGDRVFVNDVIFGNVNKVIEETLENSFICEDCIQEEEDFGYSGF